MSQGHLGLTIYKIWIFIQEDDGAYSIEKKAHRGHRLAKWGKGDEEMGTFKGRKYDDQVN